MSWALSKAISNYILSPASPLAYKSPQRVIVEDYGWIMLEHVLQIRSPHIGVKVGYLQKQIYDLQVLYSEDLESLINRAAVLNKNIILSIQDVSPKLLFKKVLIQLMACQGFPTFIGTKYSDFLHFQGQCGCSVIYDKYSIDSIYD